MSDSAGLKLLNKLHQAIIWEHYANKGNNCLDAMAAEMEVEKLSKLILSRMDKKYD